MTTVLFLFLFTAATPGNSDRVGATLTTQEFANPDSCTVALRTAIQTATEHGVEADGYCLLKKGRRGAI